MPSYTVDQLFEALVKTQIQQAAALQQQTAMQQGQGETQRQIADLLHALQQRVDDKSHSASRSVHSIPADEAKHHQMPKFSGYPSQYSMSQKSLFQMMDTLFQFLQEAEQWMDSRPTDPGCTTARLAFMLKDEAGSWYRAQVKVPGQPEPDYASVKKMLTDRYVHSEVKVMLRYELQNYLWTGKVSMRQHCEQFHMMANRLAVFNELTMEERWRWFKDSLRTCAPARHYMVMGDWLEKTTVTAEELVRCSNKCCAIVDGGFSSTGVAVSASAAEGGPVPMDIDQLTVQLQQLRAQPQTRSLLLAALGADDRGRGYDRERDHRPGDRGWRNSTPDRGWRSRGGGDGRRGPSPAHGGGWRERGGGSGWRGGRGPSPGRAPLTIDGLKRHVQWPRWAMGWQQDRIDRAMRDGQCFLCGKETHGGGWQRCPNLSRSRTPSPGRERWGTPNGGRTPRQGQ